MNQSFNLIFETHKCAFREVVINGSGDFVVSIGLLHGLKKGFNEISDKLVIIVAKCMRYLKYDFFISRLKLHKGALI
jgi:hypothetical protein